MQVSPRPSSRHYRPSLAVRAPGVEFLLLDLPLCLYEAGTMPVVCCYCAYSAMRFEKTAQRPHYCDVVNKSGIRPSRYRPRRCR